MFTLILWLSPLDLHVAGLQEHANSLIPQNVGTTGTWTWISNLHGIINDYYEFPMEHPVYFHI